MLSVELKENDKVVATLAAPEKQFKTGSRGYFGMAKIQIGEIIKEEVERLVDQVQSHEK